MKTVVISGASRGIGLCLAEIFVKDGCKVYNLSRTPASTEGVINIKTDVSDEEAVKAAFEQIKSESESVDLVFANAGYGISGAICW